MDISKLPWKVVKRQGEMIRYRGRRRISYEFYLLVSDLNQNTLAEVERLSDSKYPDWEGPAGFYKTVHAFYTVRQDEQPNELERKIVERWSRHELTEITQSELERHLI